MFSYTAALGLIASLVLAVAFKKPPFWAMGAGVIIAWFCASAKLKLRDRGTAGVNSGNNAYESRFGAASPFQMIAGYALQGFLRLSNVLILVILVNAMTAVWFSSGTIQGLVYYGMSIVSPRYVALAGLVLSTILSTLIGSSVGTVATIGVAVVGIARAFGIPVAPVAGAVMSGAIFGDRVSFLSAIYHLTVDFTGSEHGKATKRILATGVPALVISGVVYFVMGYFMDASLAGRGAEWSAAFTSALQSTARISPWVLLPPVIVIVLALRRVPVRLCLAIGLVIAALLGVVYQSTPVMAILRSATLGYSATSSTPEMNALLHSGGILGTVNMILLLMFAGMYTGIMESSGMLDDISRSLVARLRTDRTFLLGAMGVSIFSAALASNQAMAVIIPAKAMEAKRAELGIEREELAGALSDSGVVAAGIIPWNVMAGMCSTALQVPVITYAPYAVLVMAMPLLGAWRIFRRGRTTATENVAH